MRLPLLLAALFLSSCATSTLPRDELTRAVTFCMALGEPVVLKDGDWHCVGWADAPASLPMAH